MACLGFVCMVSFGLAPQSSNHALQLHLGQPVFFHQGVAVCTQPRELTLSLIPLN